MTARPRERYEDRHPTGRELELIEAIEADRGAGRITALEAGQAIRPILARFDARFRLPGEGPVALELAARLERARRPARPAEVPSSSSASAGEVTPTR